jgi:hypothetical protein
LETQLKKGNLIFQVTALVDLIYVVKEQVDQMIVARRLDARRDNLESLPLSSVVKLAEEQERLLPGDIISAIERQREFIMTPPKKKGEKKKAGFKGLPRESLDEILTILAGVGMSPTDVDEDEREEAEEDDSNGIEE